jgi:hypothetical protein
MTHEVAPCHVDEEEIKPCETCIEPGCADDEVVDRQHSLLKGIPSPLRVHEAPSQAKLVCTIDACPWDSLAQCLALTELAQLCCTSPSHLAEFTIEEWSAEDSGNQTLQRKMLAPLLTLKVETAEEDLQRVSLGNVRALRVWNHRSLDTLAEAVASAGGPANLRSLERMALKGCPLGPEVISSFLLPAFRHSMLKHLNMERNHVTDDVICNLVESGALDKSSLESINLRFNKIGSRGAKALASCSCFCALKWVNLKMNQIRDEGAIALAEKLHSSHSMRLLNIRRQMPPLTDSTAVAFADALKHNSSLEQLRLRQNRIGDVGARALAAEVGGHVQRLQAHHGLERVPKLATPLR